ncbi:hypothetical protein O181_085784 [Austropuccinia psidii MF-1]|uniref:CCHC-type domain-containing protein n=1 Tax=Austropuccinia psidii MF-1 TaxID=1389203 RepID=A0A9Q3IN41_9BASI|nr:hypothetical protein [Austropuccinia psidii MF-1]
MSQDQLFVIDTSPTKLDDVQAPLVDLASFESKTTSESNHQSLVLDSLIAKTTSQKPTPSNQAQLHLPLFEDLEDSDRVKATSRYWKEPSGVSCSICLESDHLARDCNHQLCLTCGAIDEHPTRLCPVSLVCFACGSRGHLSRHCSSSINLSRIPCGHCRSVVHLTLNCPSIWRRYEEEPNRSPKSVLRACYNCGDNGHHFGDDCPFRRPAPKTEPSVFSYRSYKHSERDLNRQLRSPESPRDKQSFDRSDRKLHVDPYDDEPPEWRKKKPRPGQRDRQAMKAAKEEMEAEDPDDWFSRRHQNKATKDKNPLKSSHGRLSKSSRIGGAYKGGYTK